MTKVLLLPLVPKGGSMEPPLRKPLSHRNFAMKFAPYMYALLETIIPGKKLKKIAPFQNGGQITDFYSASFQFWPKFGKTTFPKEFFNEIWLKVGKHE